MRHLRRLVIEVSFGAPGRRLSCIALRLELRQSAAVQHGLEMVVAAVTRPYGLGAGFSGQSCLRIAAAHVAPRIGPGAAPEAGEVAGDGDGSTGGREEGETELDAAVGEERGGRQAVEGLGAGGGERDGLRVVDGRTGAGQGEMGGKGAVDGAVMGPAEAVGEQLGSRRGLAASERRARPCR